MTETMKIHYWGIKARAQLPVLVAKYGGLALEWDTTPVWSVDSSPWSGYRAGLKEETLFGQLPFLEDGDVKVSQSGAIARYLARKINILGDNDADFALSEALVEEQADLFTLLFMANHSANKREAYAKTFAESFPAHLQRLEALLQQDLFTSKLTLGSLAIFSVLNIALDVEPSLLQDTPKLAAFYNKVAALPAIQSYIDMNIPAYLTLA
jgi:glutathione S-transferase